MNEEFVADSINSSKPKCLTVASLIKKRHSNSLAIEAEIMLLYELDTYMYNTLQPTPFVRARVRAKG